MEPIVSTRYGKLEGEERPGLLIFRGIPFASPPTGSRRWLPPEKPVAWSGVREARRFGFASPQNAILAGALAGIQIEQEHSEDCLYLNVWTPGLRGAHRPVMVWIHGGAFAIGSGSQATYDGSVLAKRGDVVVVTINYRLGPLGFLRLTDVTGARIPSTGNEGLLDQIAALEWVRDNIAEFGGDPENVTLFGESAGGMSVGALMAMRRARGLFHKAILQSGSCSTALSPERANLTADLVLSKSGVSPCDIEAIRALPPAQLIRATLLPDWVTPDPKLGMVYQPVVDGAELSHKPIEMVASGSAAGVPVMVGSTLEEWKLFSFMDPSVPRLDRPALVRRVSQRLGAEFAHPLIKTYEMALERRGTATVPPELFIAIETDRAFRMPGVRLAERQARLDPRVYSYLFTWRSPAMGGTLGACHALELGFIFGTNKAPGMDLFVGRGPDVERLENEMQDAWLAFARSGDPSCESLGGWPAYTEDRRSTMLFGERSLVEEAPFEDERRAWDDVPDRVLGNL